MKTILNYIMLSMLKFKKKKFIVRKIRKLNITQKSKGTKNKLFM